MTGDSKPGDALADKARDEFDKNRRDRELAIERLKIRAEMRSENWEEDTGVIHQQAEQRLAARAKPDSDAPPSKVSAYVIVWTVVRKFPAWGSVLVALAAIAALTFLYATGKLGK